MSKVALILSMYVSAGNASYGSDSITIVDDLQTCKRAAEVYMSSKEGVRNISRGDFTLKFNVGNIMSDRYVITCRELEEKSYGF